MTEQDREFAAEELRRYFQEADGALGVRSTQSGFEAQMNARSCVGRQDGGMRVRETRQARGDGQPFRSLSQVEDFSEIHRRLARLDPRHVRALELSYSCNLDYGGVPMALAADTEEVRGSSLAASYTPRGWLAFLSRTSSDPSTLARVIDTARTRLDAALTAYMGADCGVA